MEERDKLEEVAEVLGKNIDKLQSLSNSALTTGSIAHGGWICEICYKWLGFIVDDDTVCNCSDIYDYEWVLFDEFLKSQGQ